MRAKRERQALFQLRIDLIDLIEDRGCLHPRVLRITENPSNQNVPAGTTTTLKVGATSPQTINYQWQRAAPGTTNFTDISGATQATYTTPTLTAADNGATFRVIINSGGVTTTSGEVTLTVDATIPSVTETHGSINFNSIYVTFSEAMKLDMLANTNNYQVSGGLTLASASVLDPTAVRLLLTSTQNLATIYTVIINNIEDIAGNRVPANSHAARNQILPRKELAFSRRDALEFA